MTAPTWDKYLDFILKAEAPQEDLAYFSTIDWLNPYFQDSSSNPYRPVPFFSRLEKADSTDKFFSKIINTKDTVAHALALMLKTDALKTRIEEFQSNKPALSQSKGTPTKSPDFILLLHLRPDLSGFRDTAHGGLLSALFDEGMGACLEIFRQSVASSDTFLFTANLNVSFRAPVDLPDTLAMRLWVERGEGRKWFVKGELVGRDGKAKCDAEALWIIAKPKGSL